MPTDKRLAASWARELARRSREVAEGRTQTDAWETVRAEIFTELEQRRARRTSVRARARRSERGR
jgi:hypothetical protein